MADETPKDLRDVLKDMAGKTAAVEYAMIAVTRIVAENMPGAADDLERVFDHAMTNNPDAPASFRQELQKLRQLIRNPPTH